jgi:hypothetical protein
LRGEARQTGRGDSAGADLGRGPEGRTIDAAVVADLTAAGFRTVTADPRREIAAGLPEAGPDRSAARIQLALDDGVDTVLAHTARAIVALLRERAGAARLAFPLVHLQTSVTAAARLTTGVAVGRIVVGRVERPIFDAENTSARRE